MFQNQDKKTYRRIMLIIGVLLMLAGILTSFLMIKSLYDDCAHRFLNNRDGFGFKYDSVWDCFITRSEGGILLSLIPGILLITIGINTISKRR